MAKLPTNGSLTAWAIGVVLAILLAAALSLGADVKTKADEVPALKEQTKSNTLRLDKLEAINAAVLVANSKLDYLIKELEDHENSTRKGATR